MHPRDIFAEFDAWEERTRGFTFWPERVEVEPPFVPLFAERRARTAIIDDARKPGLLKRLWSFAHSEDEGTAKPPSAPTPTYKPFPADLVEIELLLPPDLSVKPGAARRFLLGLHTLTRQASFEIVAGAGKIIVQIVCAEEDRFALTGLLRSYIPEARTRVRQHRLLGMLGEDEREVFILNFGLAERVFRQLRTEEKFDVDPLAEIVGALEELTAGETGLVQAIFQPALASWGKELEQFASSIDDVDKVGPRIREKFAGPVFAVALRIAVFTQGEDEAWAKGKHLARAVFNVTRSEENELVPLDVGGLHDLNAEVADIIDRETHRSGMLLSLSELLTIVHPPSSSVRAERLSRLSTLTKPAPPIATGHALVLGTNEHDGDTTVVSLSRDQRLRHIYAIGASGTGKSTLLLSMAAQDIALGNGFAVLDPHGDLVEDIVARIPEERAKDVIFFDPADEAFPIGFNILSAHSELERTLLASDLVSVFKRLSTTFGDVMVSVLGNAVLAFLESSEGGTLIDLRNFLIDSTFREKILNTVRDEEVLTYWRREFTLLKGVPHAPVLTRLNAFLRPKLIRRMVAQKRDRLDFRRIIDGKTIFLAKLSHGAMGEENAHLLGSLLVSKIAQAAMSRQNIEAAEREAYSLYIDEFHHFVTPSIATILSGARKYGLGLVLAHQETRQLRSRSEDVASAVLSNAGTRIVFRVGEQDAKALAEGFSFFGAKDFQTLGVGEAIARVERADFDFNLRTQRLEPVDPLFAVSRRRTVVQASRAAYGTPSEEVDATLAEARETTPPVPADTPRKPKARKDARDVEVQTTTLPGRGGAQHKYLQSLIRRLAEDRGFNVTIEKTVLDGHAHVDVALDGNGVTVACEISVTTKVEHEVGNLTKCLSAGFDYAVLISSDDRTLDLARAEMSGADPKRVRILSPGAVGAFFDELAGARASPAPTIPPASRSRPAPQMGRKVLMTTKDAASYVGLAVQTLAEMRVTGESPPFHKLGRRVFYDRQDLDGWLAGRKRRSTSDAGQKD